jgi:putative ABC transport system permease protein
MRFEPVRFETLWHDATRGARALLRTPGFTLAAVFTLALGIGAVSAIFTVANAVLLKPLPYQQPERRVMIWNRWTGFDKTWLSAAEWRDIRTQSRTLEDVAIWSGGLVNLTGDGEAVQIAGAGLSANTFRVLGVTPLIGRVFTEAEDRPGHDNVIVLGYGLWQRRYAGDASIVGRTILVDGVARTVLGVMPAGFKLPTDYGEDAADPTQAWGPLAIDPTTIGQNRGNHGFFAAGVLKPGETAASASAELATLTANWTRDGLYPAAMKFSSFAVGFDTEITGGVRPAMLLLAGAVAFLLLIACANVASLILARAEGRQRELALRCALGAGQWRLVSQLLVEGLVLASGAGVLGLALGVLGVRLLIAVDPTLVPRADTIGVDVRVLAFAAATTLLTTFLFSLAPAVRALKLDLTEAMKEGTHQATVGAGRQHLRSALVVVEVAMAVVLVIGAVLMVQSLRALNRIELGFEPARVLTVQLTLPRAGFATPEQVVSFYERLLERVRTVPGVTRAGAVRALPLASTIGDYGLDIEGYEETPGHNAKGDWQIATDGAAEALGERLIRGRFLQPSDTADAMPVAVINETMAKTYWAGRDALGGKLRVGSSQSRPWATVVGIVGDVKHNGVEGVVKEKFYIPHRQWHKVTAGSVIRNMTLAIKTSGDPLAVAGSVRALVRELDAAVPIANVRTLDDVVSMSIATPRFTGWLLALFAGLALVLAAIGLYGVLSYLVSQRLHEIGIRMALGADRRDVMRLVMGRGLGLALLGVGVGLGAAFMLTRFMQGQLREVAPTDPATFVLAPAALCLVALAASYLPARRATRVDPLAALRSE